MIQSAVLSSASILLAILTAIYGFFYPSIKEVLDLTVLKHPRDVDNGPNHTKAVKVFNGKVRPLLLGAIMIAAVFLPELIKQIHTSIENLADYGFTGTEYDITSAAFMMVSTFTLVQAGNIIKLWWKTRKKVNDLKVPGTTKTTK